MTEQSILAYKLFLPLNIPDFNSKNCNPPMKIVTLLFPSKPPLKTKALSPPPPPAFFENLVEGWGRGGVHTMSKNLNRDDSGTC